MNLILGGFFVNRFSVQRGGSTFNFRTKVDEDVLMLMEKDCWGSILKQKQVSDTESESVPGRNIYRSRVGSEQKISRVQQ